MAAMQQQGGPVGGTPLMQASGARGSNDPQTMLNTYIYDYFLKNHQWDLARQVKEMLVINTGAAPKPSPGGRNVNGVDDMDTDSKDEMHKRPDDLPPAAVPSDPSENSFLFDWWTQFWDIFNAQRQRSKPGSAQLQYLAHTRQQAQMRQESQQRLMMTNNAQPYRNMMGMPANAKEMQMRMMQNRGPVNAQQLQQMKNQQQQMMQNQQMQRDGSQMDMNQRPQSPGSAENAPSPNKRPRLENGFGGQQMGPGARSQGMQPQQMGATAASAAQAGQMLMANGIDPNNMTPQQFSAFQGQNPNVQAKGLQVYAQNLALQHKAALNNQQLAKEMNNAGMQNSPMAQQGADGSQDFFQGNASARMQPGAPGQQPGGNHALQDYQMQLMLLEQQNKKRLLMARQEQDNITQHPASGPVGQPGFPPAMSPQGSRAGPSPGPNDQMKRGTPKLNQAGLPGSPMPDGAMPQNRSSPLPNGFDPNQMPPANKANPKKKGKADDKKGPPAKPPTGAAANKKGSTTGATPASDAENPPPTPTPTQQPNPQQQPPVPTNQPPQVPAQPPMDPNANAPFGDLGNDNNGGFNLDFGSMDSGDVLENFDFDTFLHTDDGGPNTFSFDQAFLGDGVEADAL
ncbi:putative camp-dependent protein kinase pathway protein [Neofusicoccum parvum UCRNP2]|uniref:Putative camp-dependent protein kinase pathway protein n=1 Tax=Botryosphaeria parva (strain UCR-NP2) TaxID=1287680 RepID=R1GUA2_BOTPV|nr:putative camp-dependent protein kinase pathway protein [Neofusicoccum parvum UCRNP2]